MIKIKKIMNIAADAVFPRRCPVCGEIVTPAGSSVCTACLPKLDFVKEPRCLKCGRTVAEETERFCADCRGRPKSFEYGFALCNYDDVMRHTVTRIKYGNRREYAAPLARMLFLRFEKEIAAMNAECLVPVPVHPSRLKTRGFNQAELLAREIGKSAGIPVRTDLLERSRKTEAQKQLSPDERIRNLSEAFRASEKCRGTESIILVDDIYTTGSTIEACTRVLKAAGVKRVYFLCLCIVPGE